MTIRMAVEQFAQLMEHRLRQNDHKGGWYGMTLDQLLKRLRQETAELRDAIHDPMPNAAAIQCEAADVANFAMMISDRIRCAIQETIKPGVD